MGQHETPKSDIAISQAAAKRPIAEIAASALGLAEADLEPYGRYKAKVSLDAIERLAGRPDGKLVLVTAITPTPAGEGKTTTTVGLADGLRRIGERSMVCLREPSLGPSFGMKGGAAGGGYAQVVPMEDINLHFTGDFHAVGAANNLLAALADNAIHWGTRDLDPRRVALRRALDMNDRSLREIVLALGGPKNGFPREGGFDITVASEVMAIFCLASGLDDLKARLARIVVGQARDGRAVTAGDLKAAGAMAALLKDALAPNLVQTLEGTPAFVHGGPFANIAHGCNSAIATRAALKLADWTVTEAGFGADLGAEKFFDVKCRATGLKPACAVVVATVRALKMHGGAAKADLGREDLAALTRGLSNLRRHVENLAKFGVPVVVSVNRFSADTAAEHAAVLDACAQMGVKAAIADHWALGGEGAAGLARLVVEASAGPSRFKPLYVDGLPLRDKLAIIAREIYRADRVVLSDAARAQFARFEAAGHGGLPICVAKTQYSFSTDPDAKGAPTGFDLPVREARLSAGAGFVVAVCGDILTMPGLPKKPAAEAIDVIDGRIVGLF
ncbi:MAG: formate--tetrahydrofolate ligase [Hyphomicrobiales bacterium]|nr:formate--tetrahydrofolate ligase [Hyphomicrobiales bacterium]MDE2017745.1 formate--tetrahydrofolate ligase [Hyphomicrobiales bacterium]